MKRLSYEYIRGLVEGEATLSFSTHPRKMPNGEMGKEKVPAFAIGMHERDAELLRMVRNTLGLTNSVYIYDHRKSERQKKMHGRKAFLIVREFPQLKNIIIPFFYNRLHGNKGKQFKEWLEKMGQEGMSKKTNLLYRLCKNTDYFEQESRRWDG